MFGNNNQNDQFFLKMLNDQKESQVEILKQFGELGKNVADLKNTFVQELKGKKTDAYLLTTYPQTFYTDGYKFNSLYLGDNANSDNVKLVIQYNGVTSTMSLKPGDNAINIPDQAQIFITSTSGQNCNSILTKYNLFSGNNLNNVTVTEDKVMEQYSNSDAVGGVVTFKNPIEIIEIYNTDAANSGTFTVNGINLIVPSNESFKASIGGVPSASVTVTGSTSYILTRYELGVLS